MNADERTLSQERVRWLDETRTQFQARWMAGERPRIETFLAAAPPPVQAELLKTLLAVELAVLSRAGGLPPLRRSQERFPEHAEIVTAVYREVAQQHGDNSGRPELLETIALARGATDSQPALATGAIVGHPSHVGRFQLLRVLGEGSFGAVYLAHDPHLDRQVALKVPRSGALQVADERERFLREARASAMLRHTNICPTYEVGEADGHYFLVMAYIQGQSLAARLKASPQMEPHRAAQDVRCLALALAEAHRKGVVHRDLKPANIMFDEERQELVIMDFGLARRMTANEIRLTFDGQILGTPAYMSPEQARGDNQAIGPASDIYSLGVVLYEMLAGRRPFDGSIVEVMERIAQGIQRPPSAYQARVPRELDEVCLKATGRRPADRYANMEEFAAALAPWEAAQSAVATATATFFDPYEAWLQIPQDRRPPSHYDLLGLSDTESDPDRIATAARVRMSNVRRYQLGAQSEIALKVIGELSRAFDCLSNTDRKRAYDDSRRPQETPVPAPPVFSPTPPSSAMEEKRTQVPLKPAPYLPAVVYVDAVPNLKIRSPRLRRKRATVWPWAAGVAVIVFLGLMWGLRREPPTPPHAPAGNGSQPVASAVPPQPVTPAPSPQQPTPAQPAPDVDTAPSTTPPTAEEPPPVRPVTPPPIPVQPVDVPTPPNGPIPAAAIAPLDESRAKEHVDAWANYLKSGPEVVNSLGMKLRLIPPGEFPFDRVSTVFISRAFYLGATEVTVADFAAFVNETKYRTEAEESGLGGQLLNRVATAAVRQPEYIWSNSTLAPASNYPAAFISWNDAAAFCEWLSRKEQATYRLPTEAEWEWACRAGSTSTYYFGSAAAQLEDHAWYAANSQAATHPVAQKKPNAWGLFDVYGNVMEHTASWRGDYLPGRQTDPPGPPKGTLRIMCGGYYLSLASQLGPGKRSSVLPKNSLGHLGFRVLREEPLAPAIAATPEVAAAPATSFQWPPALLAQGQIKAPDLSRARLLMADEFDDRIISRFENHSDPDGVREVYENGKYVITNPGRSLRRSHRGRLDAWGECAYEVSARIDGGKTDYWQLQINSYEQNQGVAVQVFNNGLVQISPGDTDSVEALQGPMLAPVAHAAIQQDGRVNTLLLVCRKGWVEVYINGIAICNPQPIDANFNPDRMQFCLRTAAAGEVQFERLKIYSAVGLPTPQQRLAASAWGN